MISKRVSLTAVAAAIVLASRIAGAQIQPVKPVKTGYAPVNGLKLYYEIYGSGQPLILLHGGVGAIEMFGDVLTLLSRSRQVIGVDLQAHGRTADIQRPLSYEAMADDIAGLMHHLGIAQADVMGYSLGGGVALRTAIQHPALVRKLIVVSAAFRRDGWYPEIREGMVRTADAAEAMKQTPMYELYARLAPRPADWPVMLTKLGKLLGKDYDWSKEVCSLRVPFLLVFGDADAVRTAHAVEFFELLGGGKKDGGWQGDGMSNARLAILPGVTHYSIFSSPALATAVTPFLDSTTSQHN
jgi:pimeloyl-ACP methyl ester carboxylesterase